MDRYPYRSEIFSVRLNQMALTPKEMAFAMKVAGDVTVRQLTEGAGGQLKDVLLLLWYFDQLDAIRFSEEPTTSEDDGVYKGVDLTPVPALHYFEPGGDPSGDTKLQMAIHQGYVPGTCLLGGVIVLDEVNKGRNPCWGCNGPRERCMGKPRREKSYDQPR